MYYLDKKSDKGRLVDYLNEILAAENAITERLHKRINETTINELKNHQNVLRNLISAYDGIPTDSRAGVLSLESINGKEIDITKDDIESDKTIKSVLSKDNGKGDNDGSISSSESEILRMKEDAMIKNAEMLGYKMVLNIAQKANAKD